MILINEVKYNTEINNFGCYKMAGVNKIDVRLTIYPDSNATKINDTHSANQLILNELLLQEFGFGIDEIKNQLPEHFI